MIMLLSRKMLIILFALVFTLLSGALFAQYQEDTIYLNYNSYAKDCNEDNLKQKWVKSEGIQFNLCGEAVLLHENNKRADTLPLSSLNNYPITTINEVEEQVQDFRRATHKKRPPESDEKLYQAYTKNDIFKTYLIEIINDCQFVIYPVKWRTQNVQP